MVICSTEEFLELVECGYRVFDRTELEKQKFSLDELSQSELNHYGEILKHEISKPEEWNKEALIAFYNFKLEPTVVNYRIVKKYF